MEKETTKFYPITDIFFSTRKEVSLIPCEQIVHCNEPYIHGIHVFNWSPESWVILETGVGQKVKFTGTSLVEGAVYYMKVNKLIDAGPNKEETQIMALSSSSHY